MIDAADPSLRAQLDDHEGNKAYVYDDATGQRPQKGDTIHGNLSIGVGFNLSALPLSESVRNMMYAEQMSEAIADLETFAWWASLSDVQQRALADMRYAIGPRSFSGFHLMIAALATGDYAEAARQFLDSELATQWQARRRSRIFNMLQGVDAP